MSKETDRGTAQKQDGMRDRIAQRGRMSTHPKDRGNGMGIRNDVTANSKSEAASE